MSFTPGPWAVRVQKAYFGTHAEAEICGAESGQTVVRIPFPAIVGLPTHCRYQLKDLAEIRGNVRLISAAPELLKALEVFVNKYDYAPDCPLGCGLTSADFARARELAAWVKTGEQK